MICENCGCEHDGLYGSGRFCSKKCSHSFSSKLNDKTNKKEAKCIDCGKILYINKQASVKTCRCNDCHKKYQINNNHVRVYTCKICGRKYIKNDGCPNLFCKNHSIHGFELLIKYFNFDKFKLGTVDVENEFYRIRNILYNLYWIEKLSPKQISDKYNIKTKHSISQTVLKFLDIPLRNIKEATKNTYENNYVNRIYSHNIYKSGWHTSWDNKKVYLRSSYEEDYAKFLDNQHIKYEVENLRIKYFNTIRNENCISIPDFYLPDTNTIIEIKSTWTLNVQEMKDKVKAYKELGYNFKLILNHKESNLV